MKQGTGDGSKASLAGRSVRSWESGSKAKTAPTGTPLVFIFPFATEIRYPFLSAFKPGLFSWSAEASYFFSSSITLIDPDKEFGRNCGWELQVWRLFCLTGKVKAKPLELWSWMSSHGYEDGHCIAVGVSVRLHWIRVCADAHSVLSNFQVFKSSKCLDAPGAVPYGGA